jgi:hypothetical protein
MLYLLVMVELVAVAVEHLLQAQLDSGILRV